MRLSRRLIGAILVLPAAALTVAGQQPARDTTRPRGDSTARNDSLLAKLFGPASDVGFRGDLRFGYRLSRTTNDRCVASLVFVVASSCNNAGFQPEPETQVALRAGGTVADRFKIHADYDGRREYDGSNNVTLSYLGKPGEWLQRVDLWNVNFDVPASRFITSGIPQGNDGVTAKAQFGRLSVTAIAAEQKGVVRRDRVFTIGGSGAQAGSLDVDDYQVEARRFFFTVDPRQFTGYPNVDILDGTRLRQLAAQLPDSVRPVRVSLYRQLIGGQPPNPNGPQFRLIGDVSSRTGPIYEPLRENVDFYVDPSQLWVALTQPLDPNRERLVVAYTVRVNGRDTVIASTGGTPDVVRVTTRDQFAQLLWDPNVRPGDPAFFREIRSVYRVGGEEVRRESIQLAIVTGGTFAQEKPIAGPARSYLELFGLSKLGVATTFDADQRIWPRRGDPVLALSTAANPTVIRDRFVVFPSLQPFARAGTVTDQANPSNDAIYVTPNENLYSALHPQAVYRLRLTFESDAGADATSITLGATQVKPFSERIFLDDGTPLRRDLDYTVDYDLGRVTILRADSVYARPRQVTVRFEETPLFVPTPTTIVGLASHLGFENGELNLIAIGQRQHSSFTRPQLGFADESAVVAGVSGAYSFDMPAFASAARRLTGRDQQAPSRLRLEAEVAMSLPQAGGSGQAYVASFEDPGTFPISLSDASWLYSSQPALGRALASRIGGAGTLDLTRAATMAWQTNGKTIADTVPRFTLQQIDPLAKLSSSGIEQLEPAMWLTLYPLSVGGAYDDATKRYRWSTGTTLPGRRWRSIRQVLGAATGVNLTGKESIEFWALVDTVTARRGRNPTMVIDIGDVSENGVAIVPTALNVSGSGAARDSAWTGRAIVGRDTLQSERDSFSRAFNQEKNDVGLPGDVVPRLIVTSPDGSGLQSNVAMCARTNVQVARLGDTRTNCTVGNGRLDEWDIDGDNVLNFDASQREQERVFRYVTDLSDSKTWTRVGSCTTPPNAAPGDGSPKQCWVLVRLPFAAPTDTINGGPSVQRVRAARLTMVSGVGVGDAEFAQTVVARMRFVGASWLKRSDRTLRGIAGAGQGTGLVFAGIVGTEDSLSSLGYQSPPGVKDEPEKAITGFEAQRQVITEHSLRITATALQPLERAEAFYTFPEGAQNFRQYRELRLWARGRGDGWGQGGELQVFVKIGRDPNSFYAYRTSVSAGATQAAWLPEIRVDFDKLYALRAQLENSYLLNRPDSLACTGADLALIANSAPPPSLASKRYAACADGYMVYAYDPVVSPPNLTAVQEVAVGIVRVDSSGGAARIIPGDTLEAWVDDIRLAGLVSAPGYAGQVSAQANLGDVMQVRINATRRDPNFRQLGEAPSYLTQNLVDFSATVRLDQLLGGAGGWALPVTATIGQGSSTPEFLTRSDVRASDIAGVRAPSQRVTNVTLGIRRATPLVGSWLAPIVNNLSATAGAGSSDIRSEFQVAQQGRMNAGVDYAIGGDSPAGSMPGWWSRTFDALPSWLRDAELMQSLRDAKPRLQPASFRTSGNFVAADQTQSNYLNAAGSTRDTARTVDGKTNSWRNATALELKPFDALTARYEISSTRDLVRYGDSTATAAEATAERNRVLGLDAGLERERAVTTTYIFAPQFVGWMRPRASMSTSYGLLRDPNARILLREGDTTGAFRLPRRVNAAQTLNGAISFDVARLAHAWSDDSASLATLSRTLVPVEASVTRTISSAYDGTPQTPGLGMQLGFGGEGTFLSDHGVLATTASSNTQVALATGFRLPLGMTLDMRTQRLAARNWLRRPDGTQTVVDGDLVTLPDVGIRGTARPRSMDGWLTAFTASARLVATEQHTFLPADAGGSGDRRAGRTLSYPLSASIAWNEVGGLVTGASFASTHRVDSLPGSRTDSWSREFGGDLARAFKLPADWEVKSKLRTRAAYQHTSITSWVETTGAGGQRSRLADNGREAINFNADTDLDRGVVFSLQGSRIVTYDNNLNRRLTQLVFSAVLQISFAEGQLR